MEAHTETLIHIHIQIPINTISNTIQTQSSLCHSPISLVRSVFTHIGVNVHTHTCLHIHTNTHMHTYMRTHTHTHNITNLNSLSRLCFLFIFLQHLIFSPTLEVTHSVTWCLCLPPASCPHTSLFQTSLSHPLPLSPAPSLTRSLLSGTNHLPLSRFHPEQYFQY